MAAEIDLTVLKTLRLTKIHQRLCGHGLSSVGKLDRRHCTLKSKAKAACYVKNSCRMVMVRHQESKIFINT